MMRWHERIRWLCRLIVKGRTSVRLATPELPKLSCIPIFLTGVFRSGTTLVRNIIDSHSKICCPPETNFLRPMADIVNVFENIEALRALGFDEAHVIAKIREFAAYFLENYAKSTGKPRWADKTPGYTMYLDFLDKLFPEALYVMIYRHPLDTAHSISRGGTHFPPYAKPFADDTGDPRIAAANYWRVCCEKMMDFHESHADRCFRIHYEELCSTPESTLRELFGHGVPSIHA
jgi:protein-tyrosine sulfotransferase